MAWTTSRTHQGTEYGGHFYLAKYRTRIQGAANTLVIWDPSEFHATSLQKYSPYNPDPEFSQAGVAIVTGKRLVTIWKRYKAKELSKEEAIKAMQEENDEDYE